MELRSSSVTNIGHEQVIQTIWTLEPNGNNDTVPFTCKVRMKSDYV